MIRAKEFKIKAINIKIIPNDIAKVKFPLDVSNAIVKVSNFVGESIPVVDHDGKLVGVLNEADLFLQYLKVQDAISHIEKD